MILKFDASAQNDVFESFRKAFDHPVTVGIALAIATGLIVASILVRVLKSRGKIDDQTYDELILRTRSWYVLSAAMVAPILLGPFWVWLFFLVLSLFCFWEFSNATKLKESAPTVIAVFIAIIVTFFAVLDHWMDFFTTSWALGICFIFVVGLLPDQPSGYIRRASLAFIGFALFAISLGHLGFIANDVLFRPILLWILFCTELNDVFAYISGKTFGRRKLLPNTSPNKTWGGAIGAVVLTTSLAAVIGYFVFRGTPLGAIHHLIMMGLIISVLGQCGDLVISSIKRDLEIKDMAGTIPGHGGLLDRFDSLLLVAPTLFHYINYFHGIGLDQPVRIFTG